MTIPQVQLTGRAARFVFMLRDFGHLDSDAVDRLLLGAVELRQAGVVGPIDLDEIKQAAAVLLFREDGSAIEGVLAADWPILFS